MKLLLHGAQNKKSKAHHFWFTLVASNGNIVMTSETYTRIRNAKKSMLSLAKKFIKIKSFDENGVLIPTI